MHIIANNKSKNIQKAITSQQAFFLQSKYAGRNLTHFLLYNFSAGLRFASSAAASDTIYLN